MKKDSLRGKIKDLQQHNMVLIRKSDSLRHLVDLRDAEIAKLNAQLKSSEAFIAILHEIAAEDGRLSIPKERITELMNAMPVIHCKYTETEIIFISESKREHDKSI